MSERRGSGPTPPGRTKQLHDYVIVGGGPAGLQLAYFLEQAGRDYLVLEAAEAGNFFTRFPRHRRLISNNKVNTGFSDRDKNLRWDWNSLLTAGLSHLFTGYSSEYFPHADDLVRYLQDFRCRFRLRVIEGARIARISRTRDGGVFHLEADSGASWQARRVIIATGQATPYTPPGVPGIDLCDQYADIPTDPGSYLNQRIMVVGKGNSGMETAENLFQATASMHILSPHPVRLAWTTHHVGDLRAVYNNALDSYQLKMQNTILDARLERIDRDPQGKLVVSFRYSHASGQKWQLRVDRVVLCCGFRFDYSIFDESCLPESCSEGRWPAMTSSWESTNIPDLYFAGTIMQARDYKRSFSGFIHGFRYNIKFLHEVLEERYHQAAVSLAPVKKDAQSLTQMLIDRANSASSLFQLPAFLCDAYVLDAAGGGLQLRMDIPVDYVLSDREWQEKIKLLMTLEYGHLPAGADPFNFPRDPQDGTTSQFIHPVLRLYTGTTLIDTYHVPEDLENQWDNPIYTGPCEHAVGNMIRTAETSLQRHG